MDTEAFFKKVQVGRKKHDCWIWTGQLNRDGYGVFRGRLAHRVIFIHTYGDYPAGTVTDHLCHNRSICAGGTSCVHRRCVNPRHLQAVTRLVNIRRGRTGLNARVRHVCVGTCSNGHPLSGDNIYRDTDKRGWVHRRCKICTKKRRADDYRRKKERETSRQTLTDSRETVKHQK
jgi:HNH endonuclease